jgi:type II secretory pathway component GspD/PulD (secretin)
LRLAADRRTNTIIAVGNPTDLELIRGLLARLDQ